MIEALGIPHTEVELVLVNGDTSGFERLLQEGDRVAIYPKFEACDITPLLRVRQTPLRVTRFVADAHLGGLARLLRMAGFDTLYDNHFRDEEIAAIAADEGRIVLTRDRELLKRRGITHGCYVRALKSAAQLREIVGRLELAGNMQPLTRCLHCNTVLHPIERELARDRVPAGIFDRYAAFTTCPDRRRIYWQGSHWQRMVATLAGSGIPY